MADAFINYSREDRNVAERVVTGLKAHGLTVWSDRDIMPGASFLEVIEDAMRDAGCIVTIWSPRSVKSSWVQAEAKWALKSGKLLPVAIGDSVAIPPEFLTVQTEFAAPAEIGKDQWIERLAEHVKRVSETARESPPKTVPSFRGTDEEKTAESGSRLREEAPAGRKKAFISYADEDEQTAIDLVQYLESEKCPCWISFRDVDPGDDYRASITKAMDEIVFLVLVYTQYVNTSFDVATELLLARNRGRKRFVLKIDGTKPSGPVEYELATVQWIDCQADRKGGFERVARRAALL